MKNTTLALITGWKENFIFFHLIIFALSLIMLKYLLSKFFFK